MTCSECSFSIVGRHFQLQTAVDMPTAAEGAVAAAS